MLYRTTIIAVIALVAITGVETNDPVAQPDVPAAIYELDETKIDWSSRDRLEVEVHRIIRVNRSTGIDAGRIRIWHTFFQRVKELSGTVSDTSGGVLFSVNTEDIRSIAPFFEFRLFSGDVVRAVDMVAPQPPYIIDVRWTVEISDPFFWPDWVLNDRWPRRRAVYSVAVPRNESIRYRANKPMLVQTDDRTPKKRITQWEISDWDPAVEEMPGPIPLLYVAPGEFRVERIKGSTESWNALGEWYWDLTSRQLNLKRKQETQVDQHLMNLLGKRARAAELKQWISQRWRYVAIEVGLGGWRPHQVREVFENRYGDCKDMVFLWVAMMRHIGLEAYPALVRARNPAPILSDFPKDWFDHVIGMAIIEGDTLWADLTDSRYPLGTLPRRCESRWALVVGEFGGRLIQTPSLSVAENRLITHTSGQLQPDGTLSFTSNVTAGGHFARAFPLHGETDAKLSASILLGVSPSAIDGHVESVHVVDANTVIALVRGRIFDWALAGNRQLQLRPTVGGWAANDTLGGRPDPGTVEFPRVVIDTLIVHLPPGWKPEIWDSAPAAIGWLGSFREPEVHYFEGDSLVVTRTLESRAVGRSDAEREDARTLGRAFRRARESDWLFVRVPKGQAERVPSDTILPDTSGAGRGSP